MKLTLSKVNWEGQWFDFKDGSKLKIRPRPRSQTKFFMREEGILFSGPERLDTFRFCLQDWEGIVDPEGNPVKLTDSVKETLFESGMEGIADFVLQKNIELFQQMAESEKN